MKDHSLFRAHFAALLNHTVIASIGEAIQKKFGLPQLPKRLPRNDKTAFSLVEMLMALLVASLLLAALAPVMTKKFNENVIVSGTGAAIVPMGGCVVTEGLQEDFCEVPQNTYSINAIIASGGGGGGGATKTAFGAVKSDQAAVSGYSGQTDQTTKDFTITKNMQNITIQLVGGGGGGGGGWSNEGGYPANQSDCGSWGVYIGPEYSGSAEDSAAYHSVCVSRRNPEINGGGAAPKLNISGITYANVDAGETCPDSAYSVHMCCWVGNTSSNCNSAGGDYSGCNRSLCNWGAGHVICNAWRPLSGSATVGRMPTESEINGWNIGIQAGKLNTYHSGYGGSANYPGLQLCNNAGTQTICMGSGKCGPSYACYTHVLWGNSPSPGVIVSGHMSAPDNSIGASKDFGQMYAFNVRCVLDKISGFTSYTGGGGGAGLYAKVKIPNEVIRKATKNGGNATLRLSAGGGGAGSEVTAATSSVTGSAAYATAGVASGAALYDENGNRVWGFLVPGGNPGRSASKTAHGSAGAQINRDLATPPDRCKYLNVYSTNEAARTESRVACNAVPDDGVVLELQAGGGGTSGANGGTGAKGFFDGSETFAAPANSVTMGANGERGGGGGAGFCTIGPTRLTPKCAKGGFGGGGMARFTYQLSSPGAGGGGGAAGTVVHIKNITNGIKPGLKITMKAGAGGKGGDIGNSGGNGIKGTDGESSYISYSTVKYEVFGGGGGGGATPGKPDANQKPKSGIGGTKSSPDISKLNTLVGSSNYKYYPSDLNKTAGKAAAYKDSVYAAAGGNGGINSKISPYTSLPCGGLSDIEIDYYGAKDVNKDNLKCTLVETNSLNPSVLTLNEIVKQFKPNMAEIMSENSANNYAGEILPGATGGGGGAWIHFEDQDEKASKGANGMKGYAIIYWNLQDNP